MQTTEPRRQGDPGTEVHHPPPPPGTRSRPHMAAQHLPRAHTRLRNPDLALGRVFDEDGEDGAAAGTHSETVLCHQPQAWHACSSIAFANEGKAHSASVRFHLGHQTSALSCI